MNLNLDAKRILCYGDSNTWGYIPGSGERYSVNIRWTGLLQAKLGESYEVIEEGLNGRTTVHDDPDTGRIGKSGKTYLLPCLESQNPFDIIVVMLGTNDAKVKFNRTSKQIVEGLEELTVIIKDRAKNKAGNTPQIIIVSPPHVNENVEGAGEKYKGSEDKLSILAEEYKKLAEREGCLFVNIASHVIPSQKDGLHLEPESHRRIAEVLASKIQSLNLQ